MTTAAENIAEQIRDGDIGAFEDLFRSYYARLCGYAMKYIREKDQAEEIVQELFFALWSKHENFIITVSVESYLFRSVRNACLNYIKHLGIRGEHAEYVKSSTSDHSGSVHEAMEYLELKHQIDEAVDLLPPERKKIFIMSREDGLKYREIAEKLNVSVKTVEAQMGKALEFMREKLAQYLVVIIFMAFVVKIILIFLHYE